MENNNDFFDFIGDDIYSSSQGAEHNYEDIVSDSALKGKHFAKKKRGNRFTKWWRRRKKWQKTVMISAVSLVLAVCVAFGVLLKIFDYNYNAITSNPEDLGFESVINKKIVNVALFGIDSRQVDSFKGLSDSIMILSLNTETKKVKVISVMRDSLVPITYNGKTVYGKINSAYNKGPEIAIKTLNTIFGLDISEYATVNFYGMADIIDAVGGIDVTLAEGELDVYGYENGRKVNWGLNGCIAEQCSYMGLDPDKYYVKEAGFKHLNGVQAVAYARIRHAANIEGTNDDYGRTDRQRYVMEQLFNKAVTLSKSQYVKLAKALMPCSETSLSYSEIMSLAVNILLSNPTFEQSRVPLTDYQMGSKSVSGYGSCVYYDLDYAGKIIRAFIYDDITPEDYMEANGIEKKDWYANRYSSSGGTVSGSTSSKNTLSSSSSVTSSDTDSEPSSSDGTVSEIESSDNTSVSESTDSSASEPSDSSSSSGSTESPVTSEPPVTPPETDNPPEQTE
ncbi:MAG: LCP family protein [Acutalibacteraceae bacterium]